MSDDRQLLSVERAPDGLFVLEGELDTVTVRYLEDAVRDLNGHREVTLDLAGITYLDSGGIHAIVTLARSLLPQGTLTLSNASPFLLRLFEITQLRKIPNLRIDGGS